jgi:hypothetical protein
MGGGGGIDDSIDSRDLELSLLEHHRSHSGPDAHVPQVVGAGGTMSTSAADALFSALDADGDGVITRSEMRDGLARHAAAAPPATMQSMPQASPTPSMRAESVADELEERLAAAAARFGPAVARASTTGRKKNWAAAAPLTSATANHANAVDIATAFRGGQLAVPFHHAGGGVPLGAAASPQRSPQPSPRHSPVEHQPPVWGDSGTEISNVLAPGLSARPSLGGHTPRLDYTRAVPSAASATSPVASPRARSPQPMMSSMLDGAAIDAMDVTQSLVECKSSITDECSNTRASLRQLTSDLNNFDSEVQKRIQQLKLEVMQTKQLEESLTG